MELPRDNLEGEKERWAFIDVKGKIKEKMREAVLMTINSGHEMNWIAFENYCKIFGMNEPPNLFTIPISVIEECFKEIREEFDNREEEDNILSDELAEVYHYERLADEELDRQLKESDGDDNNNPV